MKPASILDSIQPCGCVTHADFQKYLPEISPATLGKLIEKAAEKGRDLGRGNRLQPPPLATESPVQHGITKQEGPTGNLQILGHEDQLQEAGLGSGLIGPGDMPLTASQPRKAANPTSAQQAFEDGFHRSDPT